MSKCTAVNLTPDNQGQMQKDATEFAVKLVELLQKKPSSQRLLVGLSGIPGSGKSSFAKLIFDRVSELLEAQAMAVVGLDGWHLTRAQLDAFPDAKLAHERRGIYWTFDGPSYVDFILKLRQEINSTSVIITAPSFDHAVKDPVPDAISVYPHHRIVLIEGLYTFLNIEPWNQAAELLDQRLFIDVDFEVARSRLAKRHVLSGITETLEDGIKRAEQNDLPNGQFIIKNMLPPTQRIESIEDPNLLV